MPLHVVVRLPDGREATADYRDPIAPAMRRYLRATSVDHKPPDPRDVAAVSAWLDRHAAQSSACDEFIRLRTLTCGHD